MLKTAGKGALRKMDVQQSELEKMEDKYTLALECLRDHMEVGVYHLLWSFVYCVNPCLRFLWGATNLSNKKKLCCFSSQVNYTD
jgi:hypothetical protein